MTTLNLTIPLPPSAVKPNARVHWAKKARATKSYRRTAWAAAVATIKGPPPRWLQARVQVTYYSRTAIHPDPDNIIASLKAAFDGIADAGVIANDKGLWPERPVIRKDSKNARVELTITEEP